jgi:hypothetical protein
MLRDTWSPVELDLSFMQRFRKLGDGATFEQVFSGTRWQDGGTPPARVTGTLSLALRRYQEGEGYRPTPMPMTEYYFRSPARQVPNQGRSSFVAARWDIRPGAAPIIWKIAPLASTLADTPEFAAVDLVGAIKRGIESWNEAFGYPALEAQLAGADEAPGDDDVNYFILDGSRSSSGAFANWRSNPNTGEIRGASVYLPLGALRGALTGPGPAAPTQLAWGTAVEETLCDLLLDTDDETAAVPDAGAAVPGKERIERLLGNRAAHEIGHTLGLRHNFKGSLHSPSSSVMEYMSNDDTIAMGPQLGGYDIAAIRYLYGLATQLPPQPFCNDSSADTVDPDCRRNDRGAAPLADFFIPNYQRGLAAFLGQTSDSVPPAAELAPHLRLASDGAVRLQAYEGAMASLRPPLATPPGASPMFAGRVNFATQTTLRQLFLDQLPRTVTSPGQTPPAVRPPSPPVLAAAVNDLAAILRNDDGIRQAASRRMAVDILKRFQSSLAYAALADARKRLALQLPQLSGTDAVETEDLLSRIDRSLSAYFD